MGRAPWTTTQTENMARPTLHTTDYAVATTAFLVEKANISFDDEEVDHSNEFFKASEHEKLGDGGYERVTTPNFVNDEDDIFMRSMIEQYAQEGITRTDRPTANSGRTRRTRGLPPA